MKWLQRLRNCLPLVLAGGLGLVLAGNGYAQRVGRMSSIAVPEEPSVQLPSDRPAYMTSINYPLMYGAYAVWPYAIPIHLVTDGGPPTRATEIAMRPTPVITKAYAPSLAPPATSALVTVRLPATAALWFEGMQMPVPGSVRQFSSPQLDPLLAYSYDVRASWYENGKLVTENQRLIVRAGDRANITFPSSAPPTLESTAEPQVSRLLGARLQR